MRIWNRRIVVASYRSTCGPWSPRAISIELERDLREESRRSARLLRGESNTREKRCRVGDEVECRLGATRDADRDGADRVVTRRSASGGVSALVVAEASPRHVG